MSKNYLLWIQNYLNEAYKGPVFENSLGIKVVEATEGKIIYRMKIMNKHCNIYGFVHGGTLASISDIAMGGSCMTLGKRVVTIDMGISYIKNVHEGNILTAVGKVVSKGKTIMRAVGEIFDEQQHLLISSQASYFVTGKFCEDDHTQFR